MKRKLLDTSTPQKPTQPKPVIKRPEIKKKEDNLEELMNKQYEILRNEARKKNWLFIVGKINSEIKQKVRIVIVFQEMTFYLHYRPTWKIFHMMS